ncbi:hypothetical protein [Celeribacter naphthalenivorans]|uniref:hypothetical protein n=1 Tax=Celeribacter naphthalenivorans TaxID=1614694 RepID=UPI001CFAB199|nr:hypothetical protein [Celeribacter naphthalenivorans]
MSYRYCDTHKQPMILENDDFCIEDANADFDVEWDGRDDIRAEVLNVTLGGLRLTRDQVEQMIGRDELDRQERLTADAILSSLRTDPPYGAYPVAAE